MLNKLITIAILVLMLVGCSKQSEFRDFVNNNAEILTKKEREKPSLFIARLPILATAGDAAALIGTLNEKNNCLYINEYLVVIAGINITWQEQPFWIGNSLDEKFSLGDSVHAGGSEIPYSEEYDNSPNKSCQAKKNWLLHGLTKPF